MAPSAAAVVAILVREFLTVAAPALFLPVVLVLVFVLFVLALAPDAEVVVC